MSVLEQGMLAFLITTLFFMGTTLYFALKLSRARRFLRQLQQKASLPQCCDNEQRRPKQG